MGWKEGWRFVNITDGTVVDERAHRQFKKKKTVDVKIPCGSLRSALSDPLQCLK